MRKLIHTLNVLSLSIRTLINVSLLM